MDQLWRVQGGVRSRRWAWRGCGARRVGRRSRFGRCPRRDGDGPVGPPSPAARRREYRHALAGEAESASSTGAVRWAATSWWCLARDGYDCGAVEDQPCR